MGMRSIWVRFEVWLDGSVVGLLGSGQRAAFYLGLLLLGMIWVVAACRLARPGSWWARHFYGPKKLRRAEERFGSGF